VDRALDSNDGDWYCKNRSNDHEKEEREFAEIESDNEQFTEGAADKVDLASQV